VRETMQENNEIVVTFRIKKEEAEILDKLSKNLKISRNDVLRRGLLFEEYIQNILDKKERILLEKNGIFKEVFLK
jgi:nucleoid DNA-binding protein